MGDNYPVDAETVRGQGSRGIISTGAGLGLWVVNGLLNLPFVGVALAGGLVALGIYGLVNKTKTDKATGAVLLGAGGLGIVSLFIPGMRDFLFGVGGLALVGYGIFNIVKFVKGLKSRS